MSKCRIDITNLSIEFDGARLFANVNLRVMAGQIIAIIGESAIGKTTLLRAIAGFQSFTGDIVIDGRPVGRDGSGVSTGLVVLVPQQPDLWDHLTALDNVALVRRLLHSEPRKVARAHSLDILCKLQVDTIASRYPHSFSGGERQRVGLARGLATGKPILLLDEVTSNIDLTRRDIVADALRSLAADDCSIIFVTHDLNTAHLLTNENPLQLTRSGLI